MRNKEFQKLLKKNKSKSDSGFTLTELLVGLFMSIFVIGALGFGLMTILRVTQKGNSETLVRNESSRALDFISDEMRRASAIEVDMTDTNINAVSENYKNKKKAGATVRLALQIPGVNHTVGSTVKSERIIYSVATPENTSPWKGPLVIYRWGPNLDANGNYTDPTNSTDWKNQALVDGISDVEQTVNCDNNGDGTEEPITYKGFFACVVDDDGDTILDASGNPVKEDAADTDSNGEITFADDPKDFNNDGVYNYGDGLTDTNGDGKITLADSTWDKNKDGKIDNADAADVDGLAITAQLYFTGETKDASGINASTYSADTQTVARARSTPDDNSNDLGSYITSYRTLEPSFGCSATEEWRMRTDFGNSFSDPSNLDKWDFKDDAQPQPIAIDSNTLIVTSIPRGLNPSQSGYVSNSSTCLNRRDNNGHGGTAATDFEGNKNLGETANWHTDNNNDIVAISHAINFNDPRTFNGDPYGCSGTSCYSTNGKVYTQKDGAVAELNPYVRMLKEGSPVPDLEGYDMNKDGDTTDPGEQISLGEFLKSKGLAKVVGTTPAPIPGDPSRTRNLYEIDGLQSDQRIIAFEIGKSDVSNPDADPGVDFQDNIFVLQSDAFKQKYKTYTDHGTDSATPPTYSALNL